MSIVKGASRCVFDNLVHVDDEVLAYGYPSFYVTFTTIHFLTKLTPEVDLTRARMTTAKPSPIGASLPAAILTANCTPIKN